MQVLTAELERLGEVVNRRNMELDELREASGSGAPQVNLRIVSVGTCAAKHDDCKNMALRK